MTDLHLQIFEYLNQGRIQDFHLGGGGGRKRCALTHITSSEPNSHSAGIKGPRSSRVVLMLSCYLSLIFKHSYKKKNIVDPILGGGGCKDPPLPKLYVDPILGGGGGAECKDPPLPKLYDYRSGQHNIFFFGLWES